MPGQLHRMLSMSLAVSGAALTIAALSPGTANAESLRDVLTVVHETSPILRAERKRQAALSEADNQAWANALPQVSAEAAIQKVDEELAFNSAVLGPAGAGVQNFDLETKTYSVSAQQPIFTGLRNFNAIRQAKARIRAGEAQLAGVEQQVLRDTVAAYFDVVRDFEVFNVNAANVDVLIRQQRDADARFELGVVTRTDVLQAEARLAGARASLAQARARLSVSRARFKELVGAEPVDLEGALPPPPLPETMDEALAFAAEYAPQAIIAREREDASRRQVNIERGAFAPTVALTASYLHADEPSSFVTQDEQFVYGLRASIPIFQGGLRLSKTREARALNERDRANIMATERELEAGVAAAWEQVIEARSRIGAAEAQTAANRRALDGVRREADLGARTTLDVLNAEQELLNANVMLAAARRDEQVSAYTLLAVIGALSVDVAPAPETTAP